MVELDLSLFDTQDGRQKLADQLADAIHTSGFFVVKNFGIEDEKIEKEFKICQELFELPLEEKLPFHFPERMAMGDIRGYRPIGSKLIVKKNFKGGHKDNSQFYNVPKHDGVHDMKHPAPLQDNIDEIQDFTKEINEKIVHKILTLVGLMLQLPDPDILIKDHKSDQNVSSEELLRLMRYNALPVEDSDANNGLYVASHVDFGTLTCSFRQPIAGLQILDRDDEWRWVRPMNDGVVVNAGDWLAAVTGRWCRSGIHRVHAPPAEQIHLDRHAVIFFSRPNNDAIVQCVRDSPVLQKLGIKWNEEEIDEGQKSQDFMRDWIARLKKRQAKFAAMEKVPEVHGRQH